MLLSSELSLKFCGREQEIWNKGRISGVNVGFASGAFIISEVFILLVGLSPNHNFIIDCQ